MIVGPLLARFGKAAIPRPGGDKIGRRRLDTHFIGFEKLGATFNYDDKNGFFEFLRRFNFCRGRPGWSRRSLGGARRVSRRF